MPHLEYPWSRDHGAYAYFRRRNVGGTDFLYVLWLNEAKVS